MANTDLVAASEKQVFEDKFFVEYIRDSLLAAYMGTTENSVIQLKEQLGKQKGDTINIPMITRLSNAGVTGDSTLEGNEEALANYNHAIEVDQLRNGVRVGGFERQKTEMDLIGAGRTMLKMWSMEKLRDDLIARMLSPHIDGATTYAAASEANKDAWQTANADRVLFGAATANSTNDHSVDLAKVDSTADILSPAMVSLAARMARLASPHIRPIQIKGGEEWFVMFCNSYAFRDLKESTAMQTAQRDGWARGKDNPIFRAGSLLYDGVIIIDVPEIPVITSVGASNIDVAPSFLCGAQALGLAWAQRPKFETEVFDYGNLHGVAVSEIRGTEKLMFNSVQNMVTVYASGVAD